MTPVFKDDDIDLPVLRALVNRFFAIVLLGVDLLLVVVDFRLFGVVFRFFTLDFLADLGRPDCDFRLLNATSFLVAAFCAAVLFGLAK